MSHLLLSQVRSAGSGAETQLRVSWDSILNAEQTGRWWIVGSVWTGTPMIDNGQQKIAEKPPSGTVWEPCTVALVSRGGPCGSPQLVPWL